MKKHIIYGGVTSLVIGIVLHFILASVAFSAHDIGDAYGVFTEKVFDFFAFVLLITPLSSTGFSASESLIISIVYLFLLGSLVGWLYGKFKIK